MMISSCHFRLLICLWILASEDREKEGNLPSIEDISFRLRMDEKEIAQLLSGLTIWIDDIDIKMISERYQVGPPETETETYKPETETKKKKTLCAFDNARLSDFNRFWDSFGYKKGKGGAEKAWMKIKNYSPELVETIILAAELETNQRHFVMQRGGTPKWAEGWLNERRWEDEHVPIVIPMSDRQIREAQGMESLRQWAEGEI